MNTETEVDKLIAESRVIEFRKKMNAALAQYNEPALRALNEEFKAKLKEELSTSDWTKFGAITGLLWYKLDMLVNHLKGIERSTGNIDRNTARIK